MKKIALFVFLMLLRQNFVLAQDWNDLAIDKKINKSIKLGDTDSYQLKLEEKQFALINLEQQGIDLKIETFRPNGTKIEEFDSPNGDDGYEIILLDASKNGVYEIRVSPLAEDKKVKNGNYEVELISIQNSVTKHLDEILRTLNNHGFVPGFGVSILNAEEVLYQNGFGYANVEKKLPYTVQTVQNIASVSKTFIGLSLMKLIEQKKLTLDTPINEVLPFKISNPYYPNIPITIRHLATHTATINEEGFYHKAYVLLDMEALNEYSYHKHFLKELNSAKKNEIITLPQFLKENISTEGKYYKKKNFFKEKPGDNWYYSNVGAALAAYIVEVISGAPYKDFVRENVIEPLGLESAAWLGEVKDKFIQANQYDSKGNPLPSRTIITYPDGGIYLNVADLSKYLMQFIQGNKGQDGIVSSSSLKELMRIQHEQEKGNFKGRKDGLFWEYSRSGVIGHSGGDYGVSAFMYFDPSTNLGYTYVCNIMPTESDYSNAESRSIWAVLKRYAKYFNDTRS